VFVGLEKERSLRRKVDKREEMLARILTAAVCLKKSEDQLRRATRDLLTRIGKLMEVGIGIFEHSL
jgi:hypothetical protein